MVNDLLPFHSLVQERDLGHDFRCHHGFSQRDILMADATSIRAHPSAAKLKKKDKRRCLPIFRTFSKKVADSADFQSVRH